MTLRVFHLTVTKPNSPLKLAVSAGSVCSAPCMWDTYPTLTPLKVQMNKAHTKKITVYAQTYQTYTVMLAVIHNSLETINLARGCGIVFS